MVAKKNKPELPLGVLPDLLAWWRKARVKGVVIGGLAIAFRGRPRTTRDVDAIIFIDEERWDDFLATGETLTFEPRIPNLLDFAKRTRVFVLCHGKSRTDVDLSIGSHAIERQTFERATKVKIGRLKVPMASAEDLILLKAIANRPRDIADIEGLLDRAPDLDIAYVRRQLAKIAPDLEEFDIGEEFERLLQCRSNKGSARARRRKGG